MEKTTMQIRTRTLAALSALALIVAAGACNDDNNDVTAPQSGRVFVQVERLGNPLVSEVFLAKRNHGFHNAGRPSTDVANHTTELKSFVMTVAGRDQSVANTLATVLLPDMLIVQTDKATTGAGWLTWALANGYGGRKLTDDVVDAGLSAIFGNLLSPNNVSAGLTTDNVSQNDKPFLTTFPYLAAAN
jgi:hypothetical protein